MERIKFLNCAVDNVSIHETLSWMENCIASRKPHRIAVANANKFWLMSKNTSLKEYVLDSDLVIPEWAVVWGASRLGTPLKTHVRGVALVQAAIPWAEEHGYRLFFLGATPEISAALEAQLKKVYPKLQLAGCHHGYLKTEEDQNQVIHQIRESAADVLFVAMGSPKQEQWIKENQTKIGVPVAMGVGGSFDVLAGLKKDAPRWCQGRGLEWIYRTLQDPKAYWKRYLVTNTWFVWQVFKAAFLGNRVSKLVFNKR